MKTPEEIATEAMAAFTVVHGFDGDDESSDVEEVSYDYIKDQIIEAIEDDRAQREASERYHVWARGIGKNADMSEAIMAKFDSRFYANAVANAWNLANGKRGFEYWVEDEGAKP